MKLKVLLFVVIGLAVFAIAAWLWFARDEPRSIESQSSPGRISPVADDSSIASPATNSPSRDSQPVIPPVDPAPIITSVTPGMPLVRSVSIPSPAPLNVKSNGAAYRPEPHAEEKSDLQGVQTMLRDYRTRMGENPVGSNAEIMKAIMGDNPAKARLGPPQGQQVNEQGELVDRWGTPYFFHQLSKNSMEIRSAGPDQRMWTPDDLVTK